MPVIGAHVDSADPLAAAKATGADAIQFFLADPQGWKKPVEHEHADAIRASELTVYVHAPYIVNVATHEQPHPHPQPQDPRPARRGAPRASAATALIVHGGHVTAKRRPAVGVDNWRKTFARAQADGGFPLPILIENTAGGDNAMARRFDRLADAVGRRSASSARASAWTPATRTPAARTCPTSSTGSWPSPGASTSCTPTTAATPSTPAPTGTPTSAPARSTPAVIADVCRAAGSDVIVETPGGPEGQGADIDYLRSNL